MYVCMYVCVQETRPDGRLILHLPYLPTYLGLRLPTYLPTATYLPTYRQCHSYVNAVTLTKSGRQNTELLPW